MQTVPSHIIELKDVIKPLNECEVRRTGFKGFFYLLKIIIIMAKIILSNGVINVEEHYNEIKTKERVGDWIELTENNIELKQVERITGVKGDFRIFININHIQCIKP